MIDLLTRENSGGPFGPPELQDAAFNVEAWLLRKVSQGFRRTINRAILIGDGIGKPMGLLSPNCDVTSATAPGTFT